MGIFNMKTPDYFGLFETSISFSCKAAASLKKSFSDGVINYEEIKNLKHIEHEADIHVHYCLKLIEDAFVTPIDRSDIVEIVKEIENITDSIDSVTNHAYMMCVKDVNITVQKMIDLVNDACMKLQILMKHVKTFKKHLKEIDASIIEINHIEEEGDKIYQTAMRELFEKETDAKKILVLKTLYDKLENSLDKCEDVADIIQKIIISKT